MSNLNAAVQFKSEKRKPDNLNDLPLKIAPH